MALMMAYCGYSLSVADRKVDYSKLTDAAFSYRKFQSHNGVHQYV